MKKLTSSFVLALLILLIACGESNNASAPESNPQRDVTKDPAYQKGLTLVKNSDCLTCHQVADKAIGPSYRDIAAKYAGASDEEVSAIAQRIIKGGSGVWGQVPMTAHPTLSPADAEAMVQYILLLK